LIRWRRDKARAVTRRIALPLALTALALLAILLVVPEIGLLPSLGLVLAAGTAAASLAPLWGRKLWRTPLFTWGMVVAHLGIAVSLAGMASESAFTKETLVALRPGETAKVGPYAIRFDAVDPTAGPNWTANEAKLTARRPGEQAMVLRPQARTFSAPPTETSEAAISTKFDGQLYTVLGKPDEQGRWQLRLWWKPFVTLIWLGGALVALGGILSLVGRVRRERRSRVQEGFS
jgi:cytochrome c-type biogenesis protein CcmF